MKRKCVLYAAFAITAVGLTGCASQSVSSPTDSIVAAYSADPGFEFQQPVAYLGAGDSMGMVMFEGYLAQLYQDRHERIAIGSSDAPAN